MPDAKKGRISSFTALETAGSGINSSEEVESQVLNGLPADDASSGPVDSPADNGPNLLHSRCGDGEKIPPLDSSGHSGGTHDVNDELLAQEYRRGLRVTKLRCSTREELGFLLDDV